MLLSCCDSRDEPPDEAPQGLEAQPGLPGCTGAFSGQLGVGWQQSWAVPHLSRTQALPFKCPFVAIWGMFLLRKVLFFRLKEKKVPTLCQSHGGGSRFSPREDCPVVERRGSESPYIWE